MNKEEPKWQSPGFRWRARVPNTSRVGTNVAGKYYSTSLGGRIAMAVRLDSGLRMRALLDTITFQVKA